MRHKNIVREISKYETPKTDNGREFSMPRRIAHCLDWCAHECPNQFVPFNALLKAVLNLRQMPNSNSKELNNLRSRWTDTRKILLRDYKRDLVIERGIGARATEGSEDVARNTLGTKVRRFQGAKRSIEQTLAIVDSKKIVDKSLRTWVDGLTPAFRALSTPDFEKKLLPPKEEDKK